MKASIQNLNPGPSVCEAAVLTTDPPNKNKTSIVQSWQECLNKQTKDFLMKRQEQLEVPLFIKMKVSQKKKR